MDVSILEGYKSVTELSQQLVTLATGILALSITFIKELLKGETRRAHTLLKLSWLAFLLSITAGVWTKMTVTGMIFAVALSGVTDEIKAGPYGTTVLPALLQITLFLVGGALIIGYGVKNLNALTPPSKERAKADQFVD